MSKVFISHSSRDNAQAIALRDFLVAEGWSDLFLDLDPERGIAAGERWERALNEAARRCEAVLFLISQAWLSSRWCLNEMNLARRLNKRLFGLVIEEGLSIADLPPDVTSTWQLVNLAAGRDHRQFRVTLPVIGEEVHVTYSQEGLSRLKSGLQKAGLGASFFAWPPDEDPKRAPYRGLRPLEAEDAGIFFGREGPVVEAIDRLRGIKNAAPPRLFVILGASGAGKSSFMRAGLLPRLGRDDAAFLPLPAIRPERAALWGETGLLDALARAFEAAHLKIPRGDLREAINGGAAPLKTKLKALAAQKAQIDDTDRARCLPAVVISIDQGEELFLAEAEAEARPFLNLLRELLLSDDPETIAVFTIRSDNYERLQSAQELEGLHQETMSLPPMPKGAYAEVIRGPIRRLEGTGRALKIDDNLVEAILADIEEGGAKDALPLLAFTLERLYEEYHAAGHLKLGQYEKLGRIKGSIEAAVACAFKAADVDVRIPREAQARLTLLHRGLIPWLAGIDPDTGAPRRRVARLSEIPADSRPLIDLLVEQRLLSTDVSKETGETTIEPAHEALLRQWGLLQGWLADDAGFLTVLDGIKRASRDWAANAKAATWLSHSGERLKAADGLQERPDLAANLEPADHDYLAACRAAELAAAEKDRASVRFRKRMQVAVTVLMAATIIGLAGIIKKEWIGEQVHWYGTARPYLAKNFMPRVLSEDKERELKPLESFQECVHGRCPEMVALPAGTFVMGSPDGKTPVIGLDGKPEAGPIPKAEEGRGDDEGPRHRVKIGRFAIGKYAVTWAEWDECVALGGCPADVAATYGKGREPVINVPWHYAKQYAAWLTLMTGKEYRLLSEAEFEYAARAGSQTAFSFGDDPKQLCEYGNFADLSLRELARRQNATIQTSDICDDGNGTTAKVGSYKANALGLFDMHGNVFSWTEDCYEGSYESAPTDGKAYTTEGCSLRVLRGGSWSSNPQNLRAAYRLRNATGIRYTSLGFRLARTLLPPST
ncbi:protein of unknown function DUF323 [Rhodomicrobium vannielii ATCC 17100]|uniref:TIR domain-containing protein n=1 Tax=Rhodomicrobium vannielii (strain ATCC 17100 / DSM 162 / LMG 4299 / NCIMB 10020 / ATH 3.1.1) TaxID=648757 RepID=E3I8Q6_RHOVT|nr:SUMF1/EgtB/PvdO family nonheme iron enzyme [Rhodomicrobium vannielii]ADP72035.1 protein of unknown function DUF323 [Rhodomicrobium vannielii ATCC 17100]